MCVPGPTERRRALDPRAELQMAESCPAASRMSAGGKAQASGAFARSAIFPAPRNDSFHIEKWMFL